MAVLSILRRAIPPIQSICKSWKLNGTALQIRHGGGDSKKMYITASRWSYHQFKDLLHFYLMLGIIPLGLIVLFVNIYIGPAQLREIPEGYIPEKWEYYEHPIKRWYARLYPSHQEEYEKLLYFMFENDERKQMSKIERDVNRAMRRNMDSQAHMYYRPPVTKYIKAVREEFDGEEREYSGVEE